MPVKQQFSTYRVVLPPNVGWYRHMPVDTFADVPSDDEARRAYRRRLGANLGRIRSKLTPYTQESIADELGMDAICAEQGGEYPVIAAAAVVYTMDKQYEPAYR